VALVSRGPGPGATLMGRPLRAIMPDLRLLIDARAPRNGREDRVKTDDVADLAPNLRIVWKA